MTGCGVEQACAGEVQCTRPQHPWRGHGCRVRDAAAGVGPAQPVGHRQPEQLRAYAVERGGHDVEVAHRGVEVAVRGFGRLVDEARVLGVERVFLG
jgi:hypothetical protein